MSGNSGVTTTATTATTAPQTEGVVSGTKNNSATAIQGDAALKDLEAAVVALQELLDTKDCAEITSMIQTDVIPKAEVVQGLITDGELKNSATDGMKGKLSASIQAIRAKCMKAKTMSNAPVSAVNTRNSSTKGAATLKANARANAKPTAVPEEEREKKASSEAYPKVGKKFEYGSLPFTKLDLLVPLYKDYLTQKKESQTFGQYVETAYKVMKGGRRVRGGKKMRGGLQFPTRKAPTREQVAAQLWNQAMTFGKSSYVRSLKVPIPSVAEYIDDRYTPKLEKINIAAPEAKQKYDLPAVGSFWRVTIMGEKAIVRIEIATNNEVRFYIVEWLRTPKGGRYLVGTIQPYSPQEWSELEKKPEENYKPYIQQPNIGEEWEYDRVRSRGEEGEAAIANDKRYRARIVITGIDNGLIKYDIKDMINARKAGKRVFNSDSIPLGKWGDLLRKGYIFHGENSDNYFDAARARNLKKAPRPAIPGPPETPPPAIPGPPKTPPPPLPLPALLEVKPTTVGSTWSINLTAKDANTKNIDSSKKYSADVEVTDINNSLITYKILAVKEQPPQGTGLPTLKKPGDIDTFSLMRWNNLQQYGKIKLLEDAVAPEEEEASGEEASGEEAKFTPLVAAGSSLNAIPEANETNGNNNNGGTEGGVNQQTKKNNQEGGFQRLNTTLFQGGKRNTRKHKRKVSKRKARSHKR